MQGGFYFFNLLDRYAAGFSILIAVLFETIAVSWIYGDLFFCFVLQQLNKVGMLYTGIDRFSQDIKSMTGFRPGIYWRVCWKFVAPIFLMVSSYIDFVF